MTAVKSDIIDDLLQQIIHVWINLFKKKEVEIDRDEVVDLVAFLLEVLKN